MRIPSLQRVRAEMSRRRLSAFFRYAWEVIEPDTPLDWNWHIDAMTDHLEAMFVDWRDARQARMANLPAIDQRIRNLIINVPPRSGKSTLLMVCYPAWMWLHVPTMKELCISGNPRNASRDSIKCRNLIESEWFQSWFSPDWYFSRDQNEKTQFANTAGGVRTATTINAKITGQDSDIQLYDDPNETSEDENSSVNRDSTNRWLDQAALSRINDPKRSLRAMIQQRTHQDDATGHLQLVMPGQWATLVIPQEFDPDIVSKSPLAWKDPRTQAGQLMFPERFDAKFSATERLRLGTYGYSAQHQQRPAPKGGSIFHGDWFPRYTSLPEMRAVWTAWDTALAVKSENDESASVTVGEGIDGFVYALRMWHGRLETPDIGKRLVEQARMLRQRYGDRYLGDFMEDSQGGMALMQFLRRDHSSLVVIPVRAVTDKVSRAHVVSPICEAGRVKLPDPNAYPATRLWVSDLLTDIQGFPRMRHDDICDAWTYALTRFLKRIKPADEQGARRGRGAGWM